MNQRFILVGGALLVLLVTLIGLWKEESFTVKKDVLEEHHHGFEATPEQKVQIQRMEDEETFTANTPDAAAGNVESASPQPQPKPADPQPRAPVAETPLSDDKVQELLPEWMTEAKPAEPRIKEAAAEIEAARQEMETASTQNEVPAQEIESKPEEVSEPESQPDEASVAAEDKDNQETVPPENEIPVQEVESKQDEPSKPESEPSEPVPEQTSAADEESSGDMPEGAIRVKPPDSFVPNCPTCPPVDVPKMCSWLNPLKENTNEPQAGAGLRRLLAKGHIAFESANRKVLAKSRQPAFVPPDAAMTEDIRKNILSWRDGPACGFWTRSCVERYQRNATEDRDSDLLNVRRGPRYLFPDRVFPPHGLDVFPDIKRGELGSCAVVAVSDGMLGKQRGPEIDHHDTVFRYNGPMKAYARDIGKKGDVFYWKQRRDEKQYGVEGQRANKYYMWKGPDKYYMFADKSEWPEMTFHGKKLLWETGVFSKTLDGLYQRWQQQVGDTTKHSPSGGFSLGMAVLSSGLCERVDMYGFSAEGGGRYFKNAVVNLVHIIGLEHWGYRQAMESGYGACVYS